MFEIKVEVREDIKRMTNLKEGPFRRELKKALKKVALFWHEKIAPIHFKRAAYSRYPEEYGIPKGYKTSVLGLPLVITGKLRKTILKRRSVADISGTSKRVTLKMKLGLPPQYDEKILKQQVFAVMRKYNLTYNQAYARVFRGVGYDRESKIRFQRMITAVSKNDADRMTKKLKDIMLKFMNQKGPMKKVLTIR